MTKKETYQVDQCCFLDSPDYGKYILKCHHKEIAKYDTEPTQEQVTAAIQEWKSNALNEVVRVRESIGADEIQVKVSDIKEFGIINQKTFTNKGIFKSWWKRYYVTLKNGMFYWMHEIEFKMLKELLVGQYTKEKYTKEVYKSYCERKATDWSYKVTA